MCSTIIQIICGLGVKRLEVERERVRIIQEGTCEYGFRAPVYCVTIEDVCPKDEKGRICVFA